jgi:Flp pilus assembly protein TadG
MRYLSIIIVSLLLCLTSCREDFSFEPSNGNLEFSKSTVYLDTVFTNIGSSTYTLKVYNRSKKDIKIPKIQLEKGLASKYRMTVDGISGNNKIFDNVELLAKDSLYIYIEVTTDVASANPTDFLYTDKILFDGGSNLQSVNLVTLIQDAVFIFPNRALGSDIKEKLAVEGLTAIEGHTLTTPAELTWTSAKPYVVYGYAAVPNGSTLTIEKGTQVYFHADSGLVVDNTAVLKINGEINNTNPTTGEIINRNEVTFEGDRLEPGFEDVPGQWGTILIFSGSTQNKIDYLKLKNAAVGIFMQTNINGNTPKLEIKNSQIYNCSNIGLLARNSNVTGQNLVINYCGQYSLACTQGGNYDFTHCTFNNNWNSTKQVAVEIDNNITVNHIPTETFPLTSNFKNCIIHGTNNIELFIDKATSNHTFTTTFDHCLVQFKDESYPSILSQTIYNNIRAGNTFGNILSPNPKFKNVNKNKLNILTGSGAIGNGNATFSTFNDILNNTRGTVTSDIGAYNFIP